MFFSQITKKIVFHATILADLNRKKELEVFQSTHRMRWVIKGFDSQGAENGKEEKKRRKKWNVMSEGDKDQEANLPEVPKDGWGKYAPTMQLHSYCMRFFLAVTKC